jgi:hypothetical protein
MRVNALLMGKALRERAAGTAIAVAVSTALVRERR